MDTQPTSLNYRHAQQQDLIAQIQAALEPRFEELLKAMLQEERGWRAGRETACANAGGDAAAEEEEEEDDNDDSDYHDGCDDAEYYLEEYEYYRDRASEDDAVVLAYRPRDYGQIFFDCVVKCLEVIRAMAKGVLVVMAVIVLTVMFLNCCEWLVSEWEGGRWG
ncbi:hypothetical protein Tdes44962_MAKER01856 [Teratosphaeria destructans]|uniref:Uncharacterized protein n=1 Tax=Teratosphaeria destructans TaxID=418781 RepID=A0A9W7SWK0_9PEZI|nr:hypothetical protein Tdes44962_MAKER01856 [Teratosphaeria destructans]